MGGPSPIESMMRAEMLASQDCVLTSDTQIPLCITKEGKVSDKICLVKWMDSAFVRGWTDKYEKPPKIVECESVGWIWEEDDEKIVLVSCRNENEYGSVWVIPRSSIYLQLELRVVEEEDKPEGREALLTALENLKKERDAWRIKYQELFRKENVESDDERLKELWLKKELEMTYPYGE